MSDKTQPLPPLQEPKLCTVCGIDCTNKRRTKDAKGGYVCENCMKRVQTTAFALKNPAKPVSASGPGGAEGPEDNSVMLDMGGRTQAMAGGKVCPKCERVINLNDAICLGCGYDLQHSRAVKTKIERMERPPQGTGGKSSQKVLYASVALAAIGGIGAWMMWFR